MGNNLQHYGVLGMRWGKHKLQEKARYNAQKQERARFQSDLKKAGSSASQKSVLEIAKRHDANMKKIQADFEAATGPKISFGEKVAKAYGMKKNSKGQWVAGPGSYTKAALTGVALGFTSFFVEMKVRDFVASKGIETVVQSAEYLNWLKNG